MFRWKRLYFPFLIQNHQVGRLRHAASLLTVSAIRPGCQSRKHSGAPPGHYFGSRWVLQCQGAARELRPHLGGVQVAARAKESLRALNQAGYRIIIVSNQAGGEP